MVETRHGAGSFYDDIRPDRRARSPPTIARRHLRDHNAEAARQGIGADELRRAFDDESGGSK
jgi:hypothetical protein